MQSSKMKSVEEYKKILWDKYLEANDDEIEDRYRHSIAVSKKALEIIDTFNLNVDPKKAEIAGILHDYAKFESMDKYKEIVEEYQLDRDILNKSPKILHALLGPYIIQKELNLFDKEILDAIKNHTTGSLNMSILSEVIFLADYTDDTRVEEYFEEAKRLSKINFKKAIAAKIKKRIDSRPDIVDEEALKMYKKYMED